MPWIKLPTAAMREVGPAAQTLGGLLSLTNRETFRKVEKIAAAARVPLATCRKHLVTLEEHGYIQNRGREKTPLGAPRRSCTITITNKTKAAISRGRGDGELVYGVLPWWATANIRTLYARRSGRRVAQCRESRVTVIQTGRMPWSARAVLSIVMARLMSLIATIEAQEGKADLHSDEPWGSIDNLGGKDRFRWPLVGRNGKGLVYLTGLHHEAVTTGKRWLHDHGIITLRDGRNGGDSGENVAAWLVPSETFRIVETPANREGFVYVDLVA